jgi:peptide/nickel transport system substrate-binding protein
MVGSITRREFMREKRSQWLLGMIVLALLTFLSCGSADFLSAAPSGTLRQAVHWSISADWLDPATGGFSTSAYSPMYLIHDALLKAMPEGPYTPCLAESWTISPDYRIYEFKLRQGVKFHNGDTMTAEDVVFSFGRYKAAQAKFLHEKIERAEVVNPTLVRFYFKSPFPDFLDYLLYGATTLGWIVPKKYVEQVGDAGFKRHPIGCGPYKFVEFTPGVRLMGEAFEGYWRKVPNIKRIEFYMISEPATRLAMVRRGEADAATFMISVFYDDVKKDPKLKLFMPQSPVLRLAYMTSQWDTKSPWSDIRVRKAASLAIDRKTLADVHSPGAYTIGGIGLKGDPLKVEFPVDPYDPERAKKLLEEAGYPKGFHGGKYYPFNGPMWPMGEQVANYWKAIGITVDTVLLERPAWMAARDGGKMKGAVFIDLTTAPTIGGQLSYLLGSGAYGNYPEIQMLWNQYQTEVSANSRKDLIGRVQRLIHDKMMWISIMSTTVPTAVGSRVKGDPFKIPFVWFTAPFEDIELVE